MFLFISSFLLILYNFRIKLKMSVILSNIFILFLDLQITLILYKTVFIEITSSKQQTPPFTLIWLMET